VKGHDKTELVFQIFFAYSNILDAVKTFVIREGLKQKLEEMLKTNQK
jgi:hypothetical protein